MTRVAIVLSLIAALFSTGCAMADDGYVVKSKQIREIFADRALQDLSAAAARGDVATVRQLVDRGVDPNVEGNEYVTPLIWAFLGESKVGMDALIGSGADPNFKLTDGSSALSLAMYSTNPAWLRFFLERGGDPNTVDHHDTPLLIRAIGLPGTEHLEVLIEYGADIEQPNRIGETAFLASVGRGRFDLAYLLMDSGADIWVEIPHATVGTRIGSSRIVKGNERERAEQRQWRAKVEERLRAAGMEIQYTERYR